MSIRTAISSALLLAALVLALPAAAQQSLKSYRKGVQAAVQRSLPENMNVGDVKVRGIKAYDSKKTVNVDLSETYSYVPFTHSDLDDLSAKVREALPKQYAGYKVTFTIMGVPASKYIPVFTDGMRRSHGTGFVTRVEPLFTTGKGLSGNIIALWQSHGWYFEPKENRWEWQRSRVMETVEDLYTQSYVMPFLMPMLERAGAYVMSPRERDVSITEVIVDADGGKAQAGYSEASGSEKWGKGRGKGFAYDREAYRDFENPFEQGTYRSVKTTSDSSGVSTARWCADMPCAGTYAIYISYKSLANSSDAVKYTVNALDGKHLFVVNQKMGGGTWIYLGHFPLKKGRNEAVVEVNNYYAQGGAEVTADAVKIGGGMGNIARKPQALAENVKSSDNKAEKPLELPDIDYRYSTSGYPRFTEGARYFLQWAGVPDTVYSPSGGVNDYTDDYKSRALWVNWLAGGSEALPGQKGLNIPVDISMAFHTDAGTTPNDTTIGTLGIYYTNKFGSYANGTPRNTSRALADMIVTNIVSDVRAQFDPSWTRRGLWDKSYFEARLPEVPTMLLELLSHQNFADMKHGLDPAFRFTVSRAVYKGMLEYIATRDGREYVVQPLPVNSFAITPAGKGLFELTWKATADTLCDRAEATSFIVYERIGADGVFVVKDIVATPEYEVSITDNLIHSYRIEAMNEGGRSFPSETLACGVAAGSKGTVMVVNGFTRVSAPDWFDAGELAGFCDTRDHGVPYISDICYVGSQTEFRRSIPWMDDDAPGFGASRADYETRIVAGNTFDYPALHGEAIMAAGYSFVSASADAVSQGGVKLDGYKAVDLILGKQKAVTIGRGAVPSRYMAFPAGLRKAISGYCTNGGNMFVSGSYVATDIWDNPASGCGDIEKSFATDVLGYQWRTGQASTTGDVRSVPSIHRSLDIGGGQWHFSSELNQTTYCVESPDGIIPADTKRGGVIMRYSENNIPAGVAVSMKGHNSVVLGFPFEAIESQDGRNLLMSHILKFLTTGK